MRRDAPVTHPDEEDRALRVLVDRIPDTCLLETDRSGTITWIGSSSEVFFGAAPHEVVGKFNYKDFHPREEMEACEDDAEFGRQVGEQGWTEAEWTVVPKKGPTFRAVVTLVRKPQRQDEDRESSGGWIALYRKVRDA